MVNSLPLRRAPAHPTGQRRTALLVTLLTVSLLHGHALADPPKARPKPPAKGERIQVARSGHYHADEVPMKNGEQWFLALPKDESIRFKLGSITVKSAQEGMEGDKLLGAEADTPPLFMLRGIAASTLERATTCPGLRHEPPGRVLKAGELIPCPLPAQPEAALRAAPPAGSPGSVELVLSHGKQRQVIGTYAESGNGMGEFIHVVWAGDLDGDGALDLLTDERLWYNQTVNLVLYLSSRARDGQLASPVARFSGVGG